MMKVLLPVSLEEFWKIKGEEPKAMIMGGGTDLLVKLREAGPDTRTILALEKIMELQQIELTPSEVIIGAMVTHQQLLDNPIINCHLSALGAAAAVLGSPAIRHMATIGGNICTASPAGDTLPPLYVLQAQLEITSRRGSRMMDIEDFIQGPGKTSLKEDELLTKIRIPLPAAATSSYYFKVGQRKALAIAVCSMAVALQVQAEQIERVRIAWGSVGPTVMVFPEADKMLQGRTLSVGLLREYGERAAQQVQPISDIRASARYRRMLVANLPLRILSS